MLEADRLITSTPRDRDEQVDRAIRPLRLADYIGQPSVREQMELFIQAARGRSEALDHTLIFGPPGLGKTTLANIIAQEMNVSIKSTSGPVLERPGDLAALLTNLEPGDVLFIDEIHRLSPIVEEVLYPAMEDFQLDIMIGEGPAARSIKLDLPPFTLVGATTRAGMLTNPLRDRFGIVHRLEFYTTEELALIVARSARILGVDMNPEGALEIARRSRGTPRIANRLLRRVRDYAQVKANGEVTVAIAAEALQMVDVDAEGFDFEIIKMYDLSRNKSKVVVFESCHLSREEYAEVEAYFASNGYDIQKVGHDSVAVLSEFTLGREILEQVKKEIGIPKPIIMLLSLGLSP